MSIQSTELIYYYLSQINTARGSPQEIIDRLRNRKFISEDQFKHSVIQNIRFKTEEGQKGIEQAIGFLEGIDKLDDLQLSHALCECAYQLGEQIKKQKQPKNQREYQNNIYQQLQKLQISNFNEIFIIVDYGFRQDPQVLPSIIVDDGNQSRSKRKIILDKQMKYLGVSVHQHEQYDYMVVFLLTAQIEEQSQSKCKCVLF